MADVAIDELHAIVRQGFEGIDDRFARVDGAITDVRTEMRAEFANVREEMRQQAERLRAEITSEIKGEIKAEIKAEGDTTRRHFNIMVERVEAAVKIVAEGIMHHSTVLDDHERRLQTIEKRM
jgi:F0F1-type ATP synthase membrane subunit b/b'